MKGWLIFFLSMIDDNVENNGVRNEPMNMLLTIMYNNVTFN